jgi:hypothetical protein
MPCLDREGDSERDKRDIKRDTIPVPNSVSFCLELGRIHGSRRRNHDPHQTNSPQWHTSKPLSPMKSMPSFTSGINFLSPWSLLSCSSPLSLSSPLSRSMGQWDKRDQRDTFLCIEQESAMGGVNGAGADTPGWGGENPLEVTRSRALTSSFPRIEILIPTS